MTNVPMDWLHHHHHHHHSLPNLKIHLAFLLEKALSKEKFARKIKLSNQA
jgi:hypothetical protein